MNTNKLDISTKDLKWLKTALDKKDIREFTKVILVKNNIAYATNGYVAYKLVLNNKNILDGQYDYNGYLLSETVRHPLENKDLFLNNYNKREVDLTLIQSKLDILQINDSNYGINIGFLQNALNTTKNANFSTNDENTNIRIEYDNKECILMAIKLQ